MVGTFLGKVKVKLLAYISKNISVFFTLLASDMTLSGGPYEWTLCCWRMWIDPWVMNL
jgi:hypothetical protein